MAYTEEQLEAVQHVVERVGANWDGATTETIEAQLREAIGETDVALADGEIHALASAIEANHGTVAAASVLDGPSGPSGS